MAHFSCIFMALIWPFISEGLFCASVLDVDRSESYYIYMANSVEQYSWHLSELPRNCTKRSRWIRFGLCISGLYSIFVNPACQRDIMGREPCLFTLQCIIISGQLWYIDALVQERRNTSALAVELRLSCTNPSICWLTQVIMMAAAALVPKRHQAISNHMALPWLQGYIKHVMQITYPVTTI